MVPPSTFQIVKRALYKLFVENGPLKAFSLVLAIALVVLVRGERDAVTAMTVKVIWTPPTDRVLMNDPVDQVRISVTGPLSKINRLEARDVPPLRVDLAKVTQSEFVFSPTMFELTPGLKVVSISPASAALKFDARVAKSVRVRPKVRGVPAPGFVMEEPTAIPSEVVIEGAKTLVDQLEAVDTEVIDVSSAETTITREARLAAMPRFVEVRGAPVVRVAVKVAPEPIERIFPTVVVRTDPSVTAAPPTVEVRVKGPKTVVERLLPNKIAVAVVEGTAQEGGRRKLEVTGLPSGVSLLSVTPDTVQVAPAAPPPSPPGPVPAPGPDPKKP